VLRVAAPQQQGNGEGGRAWGEFPGGVSGFGLVVLPVTQV